MKNNKFRVWDEAQRKFLKEGYENYYLNLNGKVIVAIPNPNGGDILGEVCEPIIQQFTGLSDKSGREIYEGDIIKIQTSGFHTFNNEIFQSSITFEIGCFGVEIKSEIFVNPIFKNLSFFQNGKSTIEIIGNIFENPELL